MNGKEEFEKWATASGYCLMLADDGIYDDPSTRGAFDGYSARQPEIDALIHDNKHLYESLNSEASERCRVEDENASLKVELAETLTKYAASLDAVAALKAEVERLRADAKRLDWLEAHPKLGEIHVDGEVKDCYLYAVSGALGVPLRTIIDAAMKEQK